MNGFCTPPLRRAEFLRFIGNKAHRLIPTCVITQSSGKQRVIDNGDAGGQSALSSDANKLTLCSPVRPAQHISLVMHRWSDEDVADFRSHDAWETGQEDRLQVLPHVTGTFLGLTHDLSSINQTGHVKFLARERLHDKARDILATARGTGHFSRGTASKLYWLANFLEQVIYRRTAR